MFFQTPKLAGEFSHLYIFASLSIHATFMPIITPSAPVKIIASLQQYFLLLLFALPFTPVSAQVSLPERNPLKLSVRGGGISNNHDQQAELFSKIENGATYTVNTDYAVLGEVELAADLIRFRGAALGIQVSGMYAHPEIKSEGPDGSHRLGLTQVEIARANITIAFNGSDPYTMFELPYHSNKEAVLGVSGMIIRTEKTILTPYATDTLKIKKISGDYCQAVGVTFGWNWRLGESGWVLGINGAVMFVINKSHLVKVETDELSPYTSGILDFAPRVVTAGIGYHF
jgi:hypothetical protein